MQRNRGLSVVVVCLYVFITCRSKLINSVQNCSSLSIVNLHPQLQCAERAFDAGIPWRNCQYQYKHNPLEFQITSLLHSFQTILIYLICFPQPPPQHTHIHFLCMHSFCLIVFEHVSWNQSLLFTFSLSHFWVSVFFPREGCHVLNCRQVTRS